ncbi:MAG: hypothetical protein HYR85_27490, partial [Planctomycetes bacterium]|nr:hypothetical protein [Planctomycetota bacterium]
MSTSTMPPSLFGGRRYHSHATWLRRTFGGEVARISLDAGMTCPNRDGAVARGGCTYCNNESFHPGDVDGGLSITENLPTIPTVHITAAGQIYRQRKDVTATCGGTVQIAKLQDANNGGALDWRAMACSGVQSSASLTNWLGSIKARQPTVSVPPV